MKHIAKERVLAELESATDKDLLKASSVLASIVSGLSKNQDFNEYSVLSDETRQRFLSLDTTIVSASRVIGRLAKSVHLTAAKVLTSVTAVTMPSDCFMNGGDVTRR